MLGVKKNNGVRGSSFYFRLVKFAVASLRDNDAIGGCVFREIAQLFRCFETICYGEQDFR